MGYDPNEPRDDRGRWVKLATKVAGHRHPLPVGIPGLREFSFFLKAFKAGSAKLGNVKSHIAAQHRRGK